MNPAYDFKSKLILRETFMKWKMMMGPMFQNQVQMHAWYLIVNHCMHVFFWVVTRGVLSVIQQDYGRRKIH